MADTGTCEAEATLAPRHVRDLGDCFVKKYSGPSNFERFDVRTT